MIIIEWYWYIKHISRVLQIITQSNAQDLNKGQQWKIIAIQNM